MLCQDQSLRITDLDAFRSAEDLQQLMDDFLICPAQLFRQVEVHRFLMGKVLLPGLEIAVAFRDQLILCRVQPMALYDPVERFVGAADGFSQGVPSGEHARGILKRLELLVVPDQVQGEVKVHPRIDYMFKFIDGIRYGLLICPLHAVVNTCRIVPDLRVREKEDLVKKPLLCQLPVIGKLGSDKVRQYQDTFFPRMIF